MRDSVPIARDIPAFVMYCVNGESGSSLLIESTDSMICTWWGRVGCARAYNIKQLALTYKTITIPSGTIVQRNGHLCGTRIKSTNLGCPGRFRDSWQPCTA